MKEVLWLARAIDLPKQWRISRIVNDPERRRVDIWITSQEERSSWFGRVRVADSGTDKAWRHLDIGSYQCFVHIGMNEFGAASSLACVGEEGQLLSRGLIRQVMFVLAQGIKLPLASSLLGIPLDALWKLRYSLDGAKQTEAEEAAPAPKAPLPVEASDVTGPPPMDFPVWENLLSGRIALDIRALPLKLLLARIRAQTLDCADVDVMMLRLGELHSYFSRNQKVLGHEIAQLRAWRG